MAQRLVPFAPTAVTDFGSYRSGRFTATEYAAGLFALLCVIVGGREGRRALRKSAGR